MNRSYLWTKLFNTNVNGKIFDVIRSLYCHTKSCVRVGNMDSDYFPCNVGMRQGENLSPLLFSIYLNDLKDFMSSTFSGLPYISDKVSQEIGMCFNLYCLLYADDTIVLAENELQLQRALDAVYEYCNKWALQVNTDKTKVVIFSKGKVRRFKTFMFGDNTIDVVDDYVYLGTTFNYNCLFHKAKNKQIALVKRASYSLLQKIIKHCLPFDICLDLYDKFIIPIMLYGCEV